MPICSNCSYELVLLSSRLKYKCSLCSRLYSQKEVENRKFREWNKKQREIDIHNLKLSIKPKPRLRLSEGERRLRVRGYARKWREENRDSYNELKRSYWSRKAGQINSKRRERYAGKKEETLSYQYQWKQNNRHKYRVKRRLADLRYQQKLLALKHIKNKEYKLLTTKFQKVLPTFLHSDLLVENERFKKNSYFLCL